MGEVVGKEGEGEWEEEIEEDKLPPACDVQQSMKHEFTGNMFVFLGLIMLVLINTHCRSVRN